MRSDILKYKRLSKLPHELQGNKANAFFNILNFVSFRVFRGQRVIIYICYGSF